MYVLCLGEETYDEVFDRIVDASCVVAPQIDREACRRLVDLVFRARIRKTVACGHHAECTPAGAPRGETAGWLDLDLDGLPEMFAAAAADLTAAAARERATVEHRLAAVLRAILSEIVFENPSCGRAAICSHEPVFPLRPLRRPAVR